MDVLSPSSSAPIPTSPPSINDGTVYNVYYYNLTHYICLLSDDSSSPVVSVDTISYIISTMACPSLTHTLTVSPPPPPPPPPPHTHTHSLSLYNVIEVRCWLS